MRGQFQRADGLILPNNISKAGAKAILEAAMRNTPINFYVALVTGAPSLDMTMANMTEPTIGTAGYARVNVPRSEVGWPVSDEVGGERLISTDWLTWTALNPGFDKPIQRMALLGAETGVDSSVPVYALSAALPFEIIITPSTPLAQRQFKYTIFL